ncbi:Maf family protein [Ningiella sp. W23]|uniref:Maf family protein n=1 Tax=Ningiella sp. W23 TaxID=3023715 RepID=UPI003757E35B
MNKAKNSTLGNAASSGEKPELILASSSVYRAKLLKQLQLSFKQYSPNIDESIKAHESAPELAARLSLEKAQSLACHYSQSIIIASDQVACALNEQGEDDRIFGKPHTKENAIEQLSFCSAKTVRFYTGLQLLHSASGKTWSALESFDVKFRALDRAQLSTYVDNEDVLDCAGSFKSEGLGVALFESFNGRDHNALIGLPLIALVDGLEYFGIDVLST